MKTNRMLIIAAAAFSLTASAQVKLNDKNADAYNVGYGVEISDFLSTASATTRHHLISEATIHLTTKASSYWLTATSVPSIALV